MNPCSYRQAASVLLCLLLSVEGFAQQSTPPQAAAITAPQAVRPDPKRAQTLLERGDKAQTEARIDEALADYEEAARYAPRDAAVAGRGAALRSRLIRDHVDAAERLAVEGKLPQAKEELATAMRIDPTNKVVAERYAQMESMRDDLPVPSAQIEGLPQLKPRAEKRSFDLRGDTRTAYEQVAGAFGIKATFDPDVVSRQVRIQAQSVDFATAMTILGSQTATFWRPVNETLIFVAADTAEKRRQFGVQAEQTIPLPSSASNEEMTELLRLLREITGTTRLELDTRAHSITMRDAPERLALARALIRQLENARGELMLEIELLEVDRNKAQKLGITPPSSSQAFLITPNDVRTLEQATTLQSALTILGQLLSARGLTTVPGFTIVGGGYTRFLLTLPGAAADFSDALSLVQSGRQVLMRAQDSKPATFFVGDRFPITLSLLSGSLSSAANSPGVAQTGNSFTPIPTSANFPQTSFAVGNNPVALAAQDFNSDGLPDIAVANHDDNTISVLLNQDNGNFVSATNSPISLASSEKGPSAIAAGAFGNTFTTSTGIDVPAEDLVVANSTTNNIGLFFGNGDGTFREAAASPIAVGTNPSAIVVADFNGDGNQDFAVANQGDNTISVFRGDGAGNFTEFPGSPFALTNNANVAETAPVALVTGNFRNQTNTVNNSAEVDLAVVNQTTNNVAILLVSVDDNLNVTFTEAPNSPVAVGQTPVAIATGDFNADSVPDLAVVNQGDNTVSILLGSNNLDGTFSPAAGSPLPASATPAGIVAANFTGGNTPSLAVTNKGAGTLGIYVGLGDGTFANRVELGTANSPSAIVSSIFTSSSLPDVALTALGATTGQGVVAVIQDSPALASGAGIGAAQTPYPASEYVDLGVKIKATPTLHMNHEVTLQLEFEIRALAGTSINGIPVITNRTLTQTVRVKDDETTIIGGLLDNEETRSLTGLPGFANIPGLGYAFASRNNSKTDTEFLILVTPRRLREPVRNGAAIYAGRGDSSAGGRGAGRGVAIPTEGPSPPPQPEP
jgi:tetratricopeptide (TPR) repeat protein